MKPDKIGTHGAGRMTRKSKKLRGTVAKVIKSPRPSQAKKAEIDIRLIEERWRLAAQAGKMYSYEWDVATDSVVRSGEVASVVGREVSVLTREQVLARVHPDDRALFAASVAERTPDNPDTQISYRVLDPDGSVKWLGKTGRAYFDGNGRMVRMIGMVTDITECKLGEEKLREYERAVECVEEFISVFDREYRCIMTNRAYLSRRKLAREQVVGHFARELVDQEIYETVVQPKLDECFQGKVVKYELRYTYPEIGERDLLAAYYPIEGWNGVDRIVCVLHDITDQKRAERALADMNRKLIEAQEQERTRIGRELHDDINQRLAILSNELQQLQNNPSEIEERVQKLRKRTAEISNDVQALSHELHPSKLEYLGVVAGMTSWCKEFSEGQEIEINFKAEIGSAIPFEIGITLFRILQEALHNAAKHSGVKRFDVELSEQPKEIHLTISDEGKGFDVEEARRGKGLGLASMEERVRLVDGTIAIESPPGRGTEIRVHIPLALRPVAQSQSV
jgi:PAS domain S-box-containing protein